MFATVAAVAFGALFSIWNRQDVFNTVLKFTFGAMAIWGAFVALQDWGYVIAP